MSNGLFKTIVFVVSIFLSVFSLADSSSDMHEVQSADILHIEQSSYSWEARVTIRIPGSIPIKYWVNCDYYDRNSKVIASTSHVLLKRVPTWSVKAKPQAIYFALCYVPS